ncbi:MAG: nuclear transport factor 2 family protein [Candidatus Dormibacteraeota bacterium]|nr:nuclear transport factor 2 family protein [Candidatus Dormibacteraeota bacterium]
MGQTTPELVVVRFNEGINGRDLEALARLMSDDHVFIDSVGERVEGRQPCLAAWRGFFGAYPDYRNELGSIVLASSGVVAVTGRSVCSEPALDGPALWTAKVRGGQVSEWRVYEDRPETRARIGLQVAGHRAVRLDGGRRQTPP